MYLLGICIYWWCVSHVWIWKSYIFGRWMLCSTVEDNLSPFDLNIACLCQSIEINNKYLGDCYISGRWKLHIWTTVTNRVTYLYVTRCLSKTQTTQRTNTALSSIRNLWCYKFLVQLNGYEASGLAHGNKNELELTTTNTWAMAVI